MDVHQKYRLGLRFWSSRFMRKEPWVRAMNRLSPIHGKAILQRFGIPNETPVSWRGFREIRENVTECDTHASAPFLQVG